MEKRAEKTQREPIEGKSQGKGKGKSEGKGKGRSQATICIST